MLKATNLKKHFGGVKAVDGVSLEIKKGMITAIIGPNGSGKTTLFNIISGIITPDEGTVRFKNNDITNMTVEKISAHGISRMFQKSRLFNNLNVIDNLEIAIDDDAVKFWKNLIGMHKISKDQHEKILELLKEVEMEKHTGKICSDLSFGQKRLIELVRTIVNPHELLMLDEPVAGVNPKIKGIIKKLILELKTHGDTIILIEHDMQFTMEIADKVVVLDEGKIIAQGTPKKIMKNKKVLEAYLGE